MKQEIKNLKTSPAQKIFQHIQKTMLLYCLKCRKKQMDTTNPKVWKTNKINTNIVKN